MFIISELIPHTLNEHYSYILNYNLQHKQIEDSEHFLILYTLVFTLQFFLLGSKHLVFNDLGPKIRNDGHK